MKDETWNELVQMREQIQTGIDNLVANDFPVSGESRLYLVLIDAIMELDEDIENVNTFLAR